MSPCFTKNGGQGYEGILMGQMVGDPEPRQGALDRSHGLGATGRG